MPRRSRFDRWRQYVESLHCIVVSESKMLYHFHRLELLETCFFLYLVFAVVGIVFEMTHIGDIAYVSHFITAVFQPSKKVLSIANEGKDAGEAVYIANYNFPGQIVISNTT